MTAPSAPPLEIFELPDAQEAVDDFIVQRGWGDGLPVVPPTPERVEAMVAASGRDPEEVIGRVPVSRRVADVRSVAVNAVMAGCRPEHLRAVLAALEAVLEPEFNLAGVQATTHLCAPLTIFGGPIVEELGFNNGAGVFGPGNRTNAVVGRALRLVLLNIGGGTIGTGDKATFGQPAKFTYVGAENPDINPWTSLREDHGLAAETSAVTVFGAEGPHNVNDHGSTTSEGILRTIGGTLATLGNNNIYLSGSVLVVIGGEHAQLCARDGLSKDDVRALIFAHSHVRAGTVWWENRRRFARIRPDRFADVDEGDWVPVVPTAANIDVTVTGGPGRHSLVIPTFGATASMTIQVKEAA